MFWNSRLMKELAKIEQNNNYTFYKKDNIRLYIIRKRTSKHTVIHLEESGDIVIEQMYPFGGMSKPSRVKSFALKPHTDKNAITIVAYRGNPLLVKGLDENNFVSAYERYKSGNVLFINEQSLEKALLYSGEIK